MPSHVLDSAIYQDLFGSDEVRALFADKALVALWLKIEVALAWAEAKVGLIPAEAAEEIARKALPESIDLDELKRGTEVVGYPILPLVRALERIVGGEACQYIHWGATTQDIMDAATALQAIQVHRIILRDLRELEGILLDLARRYKETPMAGRTHGMQALPITFGFSGRRGPGMWSGNISLRSVS